MGLKSACMVHEEDEEQSIKLSEFNLNGRYSRREERCNAKHLSGFGVKSKG